MSKINWGHTLTVAITEGVLVLLGVLVAFYFENVREKSEKLELLKRDLKVLSIELTENGDIYNIPLDYAKGYYQMLDSLLIQVDTMNLDELESLSFVEFWWDGNTEPRAYALDMMINDGSFSLINNDTLILELAVNYPFLRREMLKTNSFDSEEIILTATNFSNSQDLSVTKKGIKQLQYKFYTVTEYVSKVIKIDSLIQIELSREK